MTPQTSPPTTALLQRLPTASALAMFHALFEHGLEATLLTRPNGKILAANPAACALFGSTEAELQQQSGPIFGDEKLADTTEPRLGALRAERAARGHTRGETRLRRADGTAFEAEVSSSMFLDEAGLPTSVVFVRNVSELRAAERAARDSEQRLGFALDAADIGHWEMDLRTKVAQRSLRHDRCFGYARPVPVWGYDTFLAHVDAADRERVDRCFQQAMTGQGEYDVEFRVTWPDGSPHWLWSKGRFFFDDEGQPCRVAGIQADITARRRAEQVLQDSEQRLRLALRGGDLGLWDWDAASGRLRVNDRWKSMLGLDLQSQPTIDDWHAHVHPDDMHKLERLMQEVVGNPAQTDFEAEVRARHASGQLVWILDRGSVVERAPDGRPLRIVGTHMDITASKQVESLLREREAVLLQAQHLAGLGSWRWNSASDQSEWSAQTYRLFGVDPEDFVVSYESFIALIHPDDRDLIARAHADALAGVRPYDIEYRVLPPDGSLRHLHGRASVVRDEASGQPVTMLGTVLDITERIRTQQALARHSGELERLVAERTQELVAARDAAEQANQAKSTFLSHMSHELRTPLNAVLGFSQLLGLNPALNGLPVVADQLGHIHRAGEHLLVMIDEILDLARAESGSLTLAPEPVDVGELVRECLLLVAPQARQSGIEAHALGVNSGLAVQADRVRLRQVLMNLLTNAIKYNRRGGEVLVEVSPRPSAVAIAVRDTGIGLDAMQLARLYEPFNRLGAESTGIQGTGLGLVIARQLVLAMHGSLQAESTPGQGSVFTLSLPALTGSAARLPTPAAAPAAAPQGRGPLHVLYVEDNPVNAELMRCVLETQPGLVLDIAVDGPSGLDAARRLRPGLILLDIGLPGLNGFEVLQALRQDEGLARVPCIAVSANAMAPEIERALQAGFASCVTKPFEVNHLLQLIDSYRTPAGD